MKSFSIFLLEKKDHIIKRLKNLSPEEKDQVITFFAKKPNLENQVDWQNRDLTFKDFQKVMDTTKTERKKAVKKLGIGGLKEGKDYIELVMPEGNEYRAFIPLHWEASKLLASTKIGGVEGKWCTAYQKNSSYFIDYVNRERDYLIYFIKEGDKNALRLSSTFGIEEFRDKDNYWIREFSDSAINVKGPEFDEFISTNKASFKVARKKLDALKSVSWLDSKIATGDVIVQNASFEISETDALIWHNGTWENGEWYDGIWYDGIWEEGTWNIGVWKGGVWKGGVWRGGVWRGGTWKKGTWKGGAWWDGDWLGGVWTYGTWKKGTWWSGTWKNGRWWSGNWIDGDWENGTWKDGDWYEGIWRDGFWYKGIWKTGIWRGGTWYSGIWNDGTWERGAWNGGTWRGGIWNDGDWYDGTWEGGTWKGGYDKDGKYHKAGDSPDKWNK